MIDFALSVILVAASVLVVRRVRQYGFASVLPRGALSGLAARTTMAEPPTVSDPSRFPSGRSTVAAPPATFPGVTSLPRPDSVRWMADVEAPEPAPIPVSTAPISAKFVGFALLAVVLMMAATIMQLQLWNKLDELGPFWAMLGIAVCFAVVVGLGLRLTDPSVVAHPETIREAGVTSALLTSRIRIIRAMAADPLGTGLRLVGLSLLFEVLAIALFWVEQQGTLAWMLHLAASPLFLGGMWLMSRTRLRSLLGSWSRFDSIALAALVLLALVARMWQLRDVPNGVWFDESQWGLYALRLAQDPSYRPVYNPGLAPTPTAYWYMMVPFIQMLGRDPLALRIPAAIGGALGIGAVYLLGRVLFDRRTAVIAAGLSVGLVWHLNFSRIAFASIWAVTLDALAAAFFAVGLRRRSPVAFAAAGLIAGWGVHFYYTSRLMPVIFVAVALHQLIAHRMQFVRTYALSLALFALGFALAAGPLGAYALLHPREFGDRAAQLSIFREVEAAQSFQPVIDNLKSHLLMFNVHGDPNGRHNWTGRPMFSPVIGAAALLGLALALMRFRRWPYALLLVWFPVMLAGGVFSVSWEAPQSLRTIDEATAVALFAGLGIGALWQALDGFLPSLAPLERWAVAILGTFRRVRFRHSSGATAASVGAVALLVVFSATEINRYFVVQQQDDRTWEEFLTPHTEAVRQMNELPSDWPAYVDPVFVGHPTLEFLMNPKRNVLPFDRANLPITTTAGAGIYLTDRELTLPERISSVYPAADERVLSVPSGNRPGLYSFRLSPADIAGSEGVLARYGPRETALQRTEARLSFDWPSLAPMPAPFEASFEATLIAPAYGSYRIMLEGSSQARLRLDGDVVLVGGQTGNVVLAKGPHALRLDVPDAGTRPLRLLWAPPRQDELGPVPSNLLYSSPVRVTGLLARLYNGREPSSPPATEEIQPAVDMRVHNTPLPRPYTIVWTGSILAPQAGTYRFSTSSADASAVRVNGELVVNNPTSGATATGTTVLSEGWHDIQVQFLDAGAFTFVQLWWEPPETARALVPSRMLRPWSAAVAKTAQAGDDDIRLAARPPVRAEGEAGSSVSAEILATRGVLQEPRGVATAPDGTVYVADAGRKAIIEIPNDGGPPRAFAEGELKEPSGVVVLRDRSLVVLDAGAGALWRIDPSSGELGERLAPNQGLYGPRGIAVTTDGRIAVADTGNNRIVLIPLSGGNPQYVEGLREPTDVALLPDGNLLVAETGTNRITIVRPSGEKVSGWSVPQAYTVVGPHVAILPRGGWIATAPEARSILRMAPNGREPQKWDIDPNLKKPVGIAASPFGVVVADSDAATVSIYRFR